MWGCINREAIHSDMEAFFLKPAREAGLSPQMLIEGAKRYVEIVAQMAGHWLDEAAAIAEAAGVDERLYLAFGGGVYRNLFLHPECTSYAVQSVSTLDHAIYFHKNRDNVDKAQCAFVMESRVPGVNRFMANSDASVAACMMMVNEKGLAGSADYPGGLVPAAAPPRYRGMMNAQLLRHIAERADDCASALEIIQDVVSHGYYAGGDVNATHWLFVDRRGTILEVSNNAEQVLYRHPTEKVYFSRLTDSSAAQELIKAQEPINFAKFHRVSRDPSICLDTSISGMTVEIDRDHPESLTSAWFALPAGSIAFPLFMGQRATPRCLLDGSAYRLGKGSGDRRPLWEAVEGGLHASQMHLKRSLLLAAQADAPDINTHALDQWSQSQSAMLLGILEATGSNGDH